MPLKLVTRKDSPNLWIRGTVRGLAVFESTKTKDPAVADAVRIIRERELLDESLFGKKAVVTFQAAADAYLSAGGSRRFLAPLVDAFGSKRLKDIHQLDIDRLAAERHPSASAATRNRQVYTPFIAVWNYAERCEWAEHRLWMCPRKGKGTRARVASVRAGAGPVAYDTAALFVSHMSPAPAMLMTALFYTGMRPIELLTLEAGDVDIVGRWLTLTHTKTGRPRGVPLHEFLVPLVDSLIRRRSKGPVFLNSRGSPYAQHDDRGGGIKGAIRGARCRLAKAGTPIHDLSPYTARHTVSTQLVINQIHPHIKDQILGHAATSMSRHYTNVPQAPLIEAINTLPVPELWRQFEWWEDPAAHVGKLVKWGNRS